ncbi:MAG: Fic family protein [Bacteroidetes bacterium]|nr:Fic family protein [Bacteroidota bacterium]
MDKQANNRLPFLPPKENIEKLEILRKAIKANTALARLNGYCSTIPNENILLDAIILKEAKASSEIENIITTHDKIYQAMLKRDNKYDTATKEVLNYREATWKGYKLICENNILTTKTIVQIQETLEKNKAGIRKLSGTTLMNDTTGEIIYIPPDDERTIRDLLRNLEEYMNIDDEIDPLIKLAIIHYQFESIHPFYDGNGRTGRIVNVLYLVLKGLLKSPILYLSSYIIKNKGSYYNYLQNVRDKGNWGNWIMFMLTAVEVTALETLETVRAIKNLMDDTIEICKDKLPKTTYSKELIELLFVQPYTKIEFLVKNKIAERRTASKYLTQLEEIGVLESSNFGKEKIFINKKLYELLKN